MIPSPPRDPPKRPERFWASLVFGVLAPILVLSKLSPVLGPSRALVLALAFPVVYTLVDFAWRRTVSLLSSLGFCSTLLKGAFAFFQLDNFWFAVQEAALPVFLGLVTIGSAYLGRPLVSYFLFNGAIFNQVLLQEKLLEHNAQDSFRRLIWQMTVVFGFVFFAGGFLSYLLARHILRSPAGTVEFNVQLARMVMMSYGVVVLPKMLASLGGIVWFISRLKKLTGLGVQDILK